MSIVLLFKIFFIICLHACMCMYHVCTYWQRKLEEGIVAHRTGVTDIRELPRWRLESNPGSLQEQSTLTSGNHLSKPQELSLKFWLLGMEPEKHIIHRYFPYWIVLTHPFMISPFVLTSLMSSWCKPESFWKGEPQVRDIVPHLWIVCEQASGVMCFLDQWWM